MPTPLGTTRPDLGFVVPPKKAGRPLLLAAVQPPTEIATWGEGTDRAAAADGWGVVGGDMGQGLGDPLPLLSTFWHGKPGDSPRDGTLKLSRTTKLTATCKPASRIQSGLQIAPHPWPLSGVIPRNVRPSDQRSAVENGGGWTGRSKGTCRVLMFWLVPWERRRRRPPFMRSLAEGHPRLGPLGE